MRFPQKNSVYLTANTPSNAIIYKCETAFVSVGELKQYQDKSKFDLLCKNGCPNYDMKWSCPPYSPLFEDFVKPYKFIHIILLLVELRQFDYIKQNYLKVKAANSILKSRVDKSLRYSMLQDEFYISTGSCRLCKSCKKKKGMSCVYPEKRTYSFEALGIDVSKLALDIFETRLLWYKKSDIPEYTCVIAGLLTNNGVPNQKIIQELKIIN